MSDAMHKSEKYSQSRLDLRFGEEVEIEEAGFSFRPIEGFELEVDYSVYMYSEDGNLEINLSGGELKDHDSIADLNDELAAEFLENVDDFKLTPSGTDTIQGITGFLNEIRFYNAEEEGLGRALICSPYINQYFFMLMISSAEYWQQKGEKIFEALKSQIHFHSQFKSDTVHTEINHHPDLTIETCETIDPQEDFMLKIEKSDCSFLLAARCYNTDEKVIITNITSPSGERLYQYDPLSGAFSSPLWEQPLISDHGEVCLFYPTNNQHLLEPGEYQFSFATPDGIPLHEMQAIIRSGPICSLQKIDLNFWLATENEQFYNPDFLDQFEKDFASAFKKQLAPLNLAPGRIESFHPAPDELTAFTSVHIDTELADCSYMIAESVNNGRALNIGLVDHLTEGDPPQRANRQAISTGSPGMILSPTSPHACIVIGWSHYIDDIKGLINVIIQEMIIFSGVEQQGEQDLDLQSLILNPERIKLLRCHPLFYNAD